MSSINKLKYNGQEYDLYGLGGDVLPIGSEIDIASDAQIPAGWEEVDDKYEIYSETERCIGRWIDGKPLYRKIMIINKTDFQPDVQINHNIANVDTIFLEKGFVKAVYSSLTTLNGMKFIPINFSHTNAIKAWFLVGNKGVLGEIGSDISAYDYTVYLILNYTKTTDTANTPITKKIRKVTQSVPPALLDDYSEEEKIVGTWINGKPLYRKVFDTNNFSIDTTVLNIDTYTNIYGYCVRADGEHMPIPKAYPETLWNITINDTTSTHIGIQVGSGYTGNIAVVRYVLVIEYTKTTD